MAAAGVAALRRVLTGDRELAQDVVQEVLAPAHVRWRKISQLDVPDRYVRRMITNEFISWRRRWGRVVPVSRVSEQERATPGRPAVRGRLQHGYGRHRHR